MEQKKKSTIRAKKKEKGFLSLLVLFSILLFLSLVRIEYELLVYLSKSRSLQKEHFQNWRERALLDALLEEELYRAERYLKEVGQKDLESYICKNEEGKHLLEGDWEGTSVGGYHLKSLKRNINIQESCKLYYYKEVQREKEEQRYEIQVLVEYSYGKEKSLEKFIGVQIREVRLYLR